MASDPLGRPVPDRSAHRTGTPTGRPGLDPPPAAAGGRRARWLLAGVLLLPVLELVVAIEAGRWAGALPVVGALVLIALMGALLVRRKGAAAWRSLNGSLRAGEAPSRELADAIVLVLAGVLLIVPGFLTDLVALLLLFPPTRPFARRPLERAFLRAAADRVTLLGMFPPRPGFPGAGPGASRPVGAPRFGGDVVEGEIVDENPPTR